MANSLLALPVLAGNLVGCGVLSNFVKDCILRSNKGLKHKCLINLVMSVCTPFAKGIKFHPIETAKLTNDPGFVKRIKVIRRDTWDNDERTLIMIYYTL